MILAEIVAAALLLSLATGGSLKRLQSEPLKGEWVLLGLLPLQLLWPRIAPHLGIECALSVFIWMFMMAALAAVCFLNAPRRWQLLVCGLGIASNMLVIGLNGAMPVSVRAASEIGIPREIARASFDLDCLHEEMTDDALLAALADVVAVPGPAWQRGVISLGDLLLALGLGAWVFTGSRDYRSG